MKSGWSPIAVLLIVLALGLSTASFLLANTILEQRLGSGGAPRGPLGLAYGLAANNDLVDIERAAPAEQRRRGKLAVAALERQLRVSPASPNAWVRLAYATQYASDNPAPKVVEYLSNSYTLGPISAGIAPIRVLLALGYWDLMPAADQAAAAQEVNAICKQLPSDCANIKYQVEGVSDNKLRFRFGQLLGEKPAAQPAY
jgi:hypothetical protein